MQHGLKHRLKSRGLGGCFLTGLQLNTAICCCGEGTNQGISRHCCGSERCQLPPMCCTKVGNPETQVQNLPGKVCCWRFPPWLSLR